MNQPKKDIFANKDGFFSLLNKAISSPSTLQKQVRNDGYSERQTHQRLPVNALPKQSGKFHE